MSAELRREVCAQRRKSGRRALLAIASGALATAAVALLWPSDRVVHTTTAHVITIPTPIEIERTVTVPLDRTVCPPARRDAPLVQPATPPEPVGHVRPSATNAGWIAAWNDDRLFVSMDAGRSWKRALDGKGKIRDVDFDCHGRMAAVRGDRLGVREGTDERWHALPDLELDADHLRASVIGGGPQIVVVGHPRARDYYKALLLVSHDRGASWERRELAEYWEGDLVIGRQYEDGRILAMLPQPDCMSTYAWVFEFRDGKIEHHPTNANPELAFAGEHIVSITGWQRLGSETIRDYAGVTGYLTIVDGARPIVIDENGIYRYTRGALTKLPWKLPDAAHSFAGDAAGRLWYIQCGKLGIATRAPATRAPDPRGESTGATAAAGCDPS